MPFSDFFSKPYLDAYNNRGLLKSEKFQDYRGALADYNLIIKLNPTYAVAYCNRGLLKYEKFQDYQGALTDYNLAIKLNPTYAMFYHNRGLLKYYRFDRNAGINDMRQAAQVAQKQGDKKAYQKVIDHLVDWGVM